MKPQNIDDNDALNLWIQFPLQKIIQNHPSSSIIYYAFYFLVKQTKNKIYKKIEKENFTCHELCWKFKLTLRKKIDRV